MSKVYEYIIVGSGVAGITIAKKLLEADNNASILMLEAGPEIPSKNRRFWWDYITLGKTPYDFTYDKKGQAPGNLGDINFISEGVRVAYGGSTMHWGAWSLCFKPEDFHLFTNTGKGADWPINYEDLESYYHQAEEYLSVCGDDTENWAPRSKPYPMPPFQWTAADGVMIKAFRKLGTFLTTSSIAAIFWPRFFALEFLLLQSLLQNRVTVVLATNIFPHCSQSLLTVKFELILSYFSFLISPIQKIQAMLFQPEKLPDLFN